MKNKTPCLKILNQSNHETTIIPESVSQYEQYPLYIIIALWCQQQNRWINRNDIAQAFCMPVRRASFQLSYITRRPQNILFRSRQQILAIAGRRHPCNEIWVEDVMMEAMERSPPKDSKARRGPMGAYRSRVGNGMSGSDDVWHTLVMMRRVKAGGKDD